MYKERKIDVALREWSQRSAHKTLLLRGARQVGKYDATLGGITAISQKHRFGGAFVMPFCHLDGFFVPLRSF